MIYRILEQLNICHGIFRNVIICISIISPPSSISVFYPASKVAMLLIFLTKWNTLMLYTRKPGCLFETISYNKRHLNISVITWAKRHIRTSVFINIHYITTWFLIPVSHNFSTHYCCHEHRHYGIMTKGTIKDVSKTCRKLPVN